MDFDSAKLLIMFPRSHKRSFTIPHSASDAHKADDDTDEEGGMTIQVAFSDSESKSRRRKRTKVVLKKAAARSAK